ncbi:MAG TPA: hypothetical protein ACFYEC_00245 [Candidatus Brocadiaceae bacterium]
MPDIIVQDITPRNQYTAGGGGPTVFAFTFPIFALTDVVVYRTPVGSTADDVTQILVYNVDYTVTNNIPPAVGGTITLTVGATAGDIITLVRDLPDNRLNNYIDGGLFQATDVNTDFDRTVMMSQQDKMYDKVLGIHYNNSEVITPIVDNILPLLPANYVWMKNGANTEIIAVPFGSGGGGGGTITSITTTLPVQGGPITVAGNISLANSGVVAGTYSPANVTFNAFGIATNAIVINSLSGKNFITNGDFQIWQAGTSFTGLVFGPPVTYVADMWEADGEAAAIAFSVTRQAAGTPGRFVARVQRDAGSATVGTPVISWSSPIATVAGIAGNYLTISFKARAGANYSATGGLLGVVMYTGTGATDESFFFGGGGFTGNATVLTAFPALTATLDSYTFTTPAPVGATVTQLAVQFYFPTTVGVAGANDYFDVTDVQVELGQAATPFNRPSFNESLAACQYLYYKTFAYATVPAQNVGATTGEFIFPATRVAAVVNFSNSFVFPAPLAINPTITFYNPAAANAEARDESAAGDCTVTSTYNKTSSSFNVITTGNAGTVVGNALGVHFVADGRLPH